MSTTAATESRKIPVIAYRDGVEMGRFNSIKECAEALHLPPEKISIGAKYGVHYKKIWKFEQINR